MADPARAGGVGRTIRRRVGKVVGGARLRPTRCVISNAVRPVMTAVSSPLVSWCCSRLTPPTHGCSIAMISWPYGWRETAGHFPETDATFMIVWKGSYRLDRPAFLYFG